ncbi:trihelix transcription factor PTL-like [Asparagus officinalis]|nr:trihelix transcription factor PTL-like [Asparagus officinalis]
MLGSGANNAVDNNGGENCSNGNEYSQGRWPRQETLTLLEIRTRLHHKFQHPAAQKAPLWDEVSRIMAEEHGYQRSGKKCKEKLDNLYKYYKKTKASNQSNNHGKHYRFFKQLEALCGENNTANSLHITNKIPPSQPIQSLDSSTSSEEEEDEQIKRDEINAWSLKIKELVEKQMRRLMEAQESWMDKMVNSIERMEEERASRDEQWQKQKLERYEQEERSWAFERAWIEARDAALISALERFGCKCCDLKREESKKTRDDNEDDVVSSRIAGVWADNDEIRDLIRELKDISD